MTSPRKKDPEASGLTGTPIPVAQEPERVDETQSRSKEAEAPWTPERVEGWNRYLDRYVAGGLLILVFLTALKPISNSSIWPLLRAGESIVKGQPITVDSFSYTRAGQTWVNVPWVFEVANSQLYRLVEGAFRSVTEPDRGTWAAASALILLHATLLALAAWLIMSVRRPGPGLWWAALCALVAMGGFLIPSARAAREMELAPGGLAYGLDAVSPDTWGLVLLALAILLLHWGRNLGREKALWALPAVFALWANVDDSVGFGLIVLLAWALGCVVAWLNDDRSVDRKPPWSRLAIAGACVVACLINPSTYRIFGETVLPYVGSFQRMFMLTNDVLTEDQLGYFGPMSTRVFNRRLGEDASLVRMIFFGVVVWMGLVSFVVNRRRWSWPRFFAYVAAAVLWAGRIDLAPFFGLVLAGVLSLNGQEWYLERYGVKGRVGTGWKLWSDGGRAVTILALFGLCFLGITGYFSKPGDSGFGLGVNDTNLAFGTAEFLRDLPLEGQVLNLSVSQGDSLIWAAPSRKPFIDTRKGLYPEKVRRDLEEIRRGLTEDDPTRWEPLLKEYAGDGPGITAVIVNPEINPTTYNAMLASSSWVRLHDGGNAVVFGRADASNRDLELIKNERLDASRLVYEKYDPIQAPDRPPTSGSWMDSVLRYRAMKRPQPNVYTAGRWLEAASSSATPDPALALMAVREAREALRKDPDDYRAHQFLQGAYLALMRAEAAILGESYETSPMKEEPIEYLTFRYRQRLAELRFALQTAPPPRSMEEREARTSFLLELATMYDTNRAYDLARDYLVEARKIAPPGSLPAPQLDRIAQIEEQLEQFRTQLDDMAAQGQINPIQRADFAVQAGFPGLAIEELLASENAGVSPATVRWSLVDLYCLTGQPDKAYDLLETTGIGDPSLNTGPGTGAYRQGLVNLLLGYHTYAANYWSNYALPPLQQSAASEAMAAALGVLRGEPISATQKVLEITGVPGTSGYLANEAQWESELGLALLEAGVPRDVLDENGNVMQRGASSHLRRALEINPDHPIRGLLAYYLERLGETVPAASTTEAGTPEVPTTPAAAPTEEPAAPPAS